MNFNITIRKTTVHIEHETINAGSKGEAEEIAKARFEASQEYGMGAAFYAEVTAVELDDDEE